MEINLVEKEGIDIIILNGRLDVTTTPDLEKALSGLFEQKKLKMLIDCTDLEYISSAGLRSLLTAAKTSKKIGGRIVLANLNTNVKQIFEISGFTSIFDIYENLQQAGKSLLQYCLC